MKHIAWFGLLLTGCFYIDPINQRPSAAILEQFSGAVHRGDHLLFTADYFDPEHQPGTCTWKAIACAGEDDAGHVIGCDDDTAAFYTKTLDIADIADLTVPLVTREGQVPVQAIKVKMEARDDRGALTQPLETYRVDDLPPSLELRRSAHSYTVGAPIDLFAKYGDTDDGTRNVALAWTVFTPNTQPAYTLTDRAVVQDPRDPGHVTVGKTLVPHGTGEWDVKVTATDELGGTTVQHLVFTVGPDQPPCLVSVQPAVPPADAQLPIVAPTVFQVPLVSDDLDAYPPLFGQPQFGTTTFAWSTLIVPPGVPPGVPPVAPVRQPLVGATGNSIDFDPAAFTPGDIVELRVEIFDRNHIMCVDDRPTCSVIAQPSCLQRQTWRVEVR
ncbi:MAG TPA: hypothetical protein VHN14_25855 [Kofleriaceae bacterium]|nr:hypothetical protein [Kofleriaceae bacterium]